MLCTSCNTCAGGVGNYSCGNSNDGAYIIDPKCGQTKDPNTPVDGSKPGSEGKRFPPLKPGETRKTDDNGTTTLTDANNKTWNETTDSHGRSHLSDNEGNTQTRDAKDNKESEYNKATNTTTSYDTKTGKKTTEYNHSTKIKTTYDSSGNVQSKDYPDGGHYDATTGTYTDANGNIAQVGPEGPVC